MVPRILLSLLVVGATAGCYGYADPGGVEVTSAPMDYGIESGPSVIYEGRPHYWHHDRWYYREGGRWYYHRHEPRFLYRHRYEHHWR